jgi:hypothetical protein
VKEKFKSSFWTIPSNFAFISTKIGILRWIHLLGKQKRSSSKNNKFVLWTPPPSENDEFNSVVKVTSSFTLSRNSISVVLNRVLSFIFQSGFIELWNENNREIIIQREIEAYLRCRKVLKKSNMDDFWNVQSCRRDFRNNSDSSFSSIEILKNEEIDEKSLGLETLWSTFVLFSMGLGITIGVFLLEFGIKFIQKFVCR